MSSEKSSTIRRLGEAQRAVMDNDTNLPGGVVGYIGRLSDGHWPTFGVDALGRPYRGSCRCGETFCHGWAIAVYRRDLIDAYEAKVQDFANETARAFRLYEALDFCLAVLADTPYVPVETGRQVIHPWESRKRAAMDKAQAALDLLPQE